MGPYDSTQAGNEMTDTSLGVAPKVQIPDALWERIQTVLPGYTAHIRTRGEEAQEKREVPGYRARRWVGERTHAWLNRF